MQQPARTMANLFTEAESSLAMDPIYGLILVIAVDPLMPAIQEYGRSSVP